MIMHRALLIVQWIAGWKEKMSSCESSMGKIVRHEESICFLLNSFILSQMVLVDLHNLAKRSFSCLLGTLVALESARSMGDSSHLFFIHVRTGDDKAIFKNSEDVK